MRNFFHFSFGIFLISVIFAAVLINYLVFKTSGKTAPISPLPDFLTYFKNKEVTGISLWLPKLGEQKTSFELTAKSALAYDLTSNKVLYSKNPNERLPMASLTKIMTSIIALENKKIDDKYLVHKDDLIGEDSMGLSKGEILSLEELLYGLILHSGNDAAETIASNFLGGREKFINAMNEKTKSLGLKNTNFTNPTGLEGDGNQYTTAYDLLIISKYAVSNFPELLKITSAFNYNIYASNTHKAFYLENETNLISSYPGVEGLKTGYTPEAGLCLVTYLNFDNHKIIGILLGSNNRRQEMKDLLDFSLKSQEITPPRHI